MGVRGLRMIAGMLCSMKFSVVQISSTRISNKLVCKLVLYSKTI